MILAAGKLETGQRFYLFGLSTKNLEMLQRDKPIVQPGSRLLLPIDHIVITYHHADGRLARPRFPPEESCLLIPLTDDVIAGLRAGRIRGLEKDGRIYHIIHRETEAEMEQLLRDGLQPNTRIEHIGYDPTSKPMNLN